MSLCGWLGARRFHVSGGGARNSERARRLASDVAVSIFQVSRADDSLFPGFQRQLRLDRYDSTTGSFQLENQTFSCAIDVLNGRVSDPLTDVDWAAAPARPLSRV
jgi:hypothetical protein